MMSLSTVSVEVPFTVPWLDATARTAHSAGSTMVVLALRQCQRAIGSAQLVLRAGLSDESN